MMAVRVVNRRVAAMLLLPARWSLACARSTDDVGRPRQLRAPTALSSVVTIDPVIGTSLRLLESRAQLFVIVISNLSSGSVETPLFIELQRLDDDGWINAGYVPFVGVNPTSVAHLCAKLAGARPHHCRI